MKLSVSCSTILSTNFQLLINTKIPTNEEVYYFKSLRCCIYQVFFPTFISRVDFVLSCMSWAWKKFYNIGARSVLKTHINGGLLNRALVIINCVPYQNGKIHLKGEQILSFKRKSLMFSWENNIVTLCDLPWMLTVFIGHMRSQSQLAYNSRPPTARQRYAIEMAYRWRTDGGPTTYAIWDVIESSYYAKSAVSNRCPFLLTGSNKHLWFMNTFSILIAMLSIHKFCLNSEEIYNL